MAEAAQHVGPAFVYELTVHPSRQLEVIGYLRRYGMQYEDNPFSPHVNLRTHLDCGYAEWFLSANGNSCGSRGDT